MIPYIFSAVQTQTWLTARHKGHNEVTTSYDLNLTSCQLTLTPAGVELPNGQTMRWEWVEEITADENACFQWLDETPQKVQFFSEELQRAYSLCPTESAPTMLVSGLTMHRIKGTNPRLDTLSKIKAAGGKLTGRVLDTCMGLGYTAIEAAQTAEYVLTLEIDPTVLDVCRANPWSQGLFNLTNLEHQFGHAWDTLETLPDHHFSCVVHDPPMFNLASELYSTDFYRELHRVLKRNGRVFHYIGNPDSKSGNTITKSTVKHLQAAGFNRVVPQPQAFGLLAFK